MKGGPLLALLLLIAPGAARAGSEEFSTFDVIRQEEDDESLLDHLLTRPPREWRGAWERAPQAVRSSQGCLTSGQWFVDTRLKLEAPLGDKARFGFDLRDEQTDRLAVTYFDFSFRFPTAFGTPGFWFRPLFDKSRQDLGVFWEAGAETAAAYARVTFGFEDLFNNLWEFRQSQVGQSSEPYVKHPFEPAFRMHLRRGRWRFEFEGLVLTPSRKRFGADTLTRYSTLWGSTGRVLAEASALGATWSVSCDSRLARSTDSHPVPTVELELMNVRRQWAVEAMVSRPIGPDWEVDLRWLYQDRHQRRSGDGLTSFSEIRLDAVDRVTQMEARRRLGDHWGLRAGAMIDRVTVAASTPTPFLTYGTRTESRAYFGLTGRFGAVVVSVVEGIELDREGYDVWGVHDKAFAQLQTLF